MWRAIKITSSCYTLTRKQIDGTLDIFVRWICSRLKFLHVGTAIREDLPLFPSARYDISREFSESEHHLSLHRGISTTFEPADSRSHRPHQWPSSKNIAPLLISFSKAESACCFTAPCPQKLIRSYLGVARLLLLSFSSGTGGCSIPAVNYTTHKKQKPLD